MYIDRTNPLILPGEVLVADIFELTLYAIQQSAESLNRFDRVIDFELIRGLDEQLGLLEEIVYLGIASCWPQNLEGIALNIQRTIDSYVDKIIACVNNAPIRGPKYAHGYINASGILNLKGIIYGILRSAGSVDTERDKADAKRNAHQLFSKKISLLSGFVPFCKGDFLYTDSIQLSWFLESARPLDLLKGWTISKHAIFRDIKGIGRDAFSFYEHFVNRSFNLDRDLAYEMYGVPFNIRLDFYLSHPKHDPANACISYDKKTNTVVISQYRLAEALLCGSLSEKSKVKTSLKEIYQTVLHECVHLMQLCMSTDLDVTGLDRPRGDVYRAYNKSAEALLKREYESNGLDPDIVSFHTMDDIEFYTILLHNIVAFVDLWVSDNSFLYSERSPTERDPIEDVAKRFIETNRNFITWKHLDPEYKYTKAVDEFMEAVTTRLEHIQKSYVDFVYDFEESRKRIPSVMPWRIK